MSTGCIFCEHTLSPAEISRLSPRIEDLVDRAIEAGVRRFITPLSCAGERRCALEIVKRREQNAAVELEVILPHPGLLPPDKEEPILAGASRVGVLFPHYRPDVYQQWCRRFLPGCQRLLAIGGSEPGRAVTFAMRYATAMGVAVDFLSPEKGGGDPFF